MFAQSPQAMDGWLWNAKNDFKSELTGRWRQGWGGRGDSWPYLGWNGVFLTTDSPEAEYRLEARGAKFTVVYSAGTYTTFNGKSQTNRAGGFSANLDDQTQRVEPAADGAPLDIGFVKFAVPDGRHMLKINSIHHGDLSLHGVIVENAAPGVVVYNISCGGYWAHNFIWRQPGWENILAEINPDLTILFLSKPESGGSGAVSDTRPTPEHEMLTERVTHAIPRSRLLFFKCWNPRDGISPPDALSLKQRTAWLDANHYPYLDLQAGLNNKAMKEQGWFKDNIHLAQPGGQSIGDEITKLFLP